MVLIKIITLQVVKESNWPYVIPLYLSKTYAQTVTTADPTLYCQRSLDMPIMKHLYLVIGK